jgi:hypothetical protein
MFDAKVKNNIRMDSISSPSYLAPGGSISGSTMMTMPVPNYSGITNGSSMISGGVSSIDLQQHLPLGNEESTEKTPGGPAYPPHCDKFEDAYDAVVQMGNNWIVSVMLVLNTFSIAFFNFFGVSVTKHMSASTRMVLDSLRTMVIWLKV